VGFFIDWSFRPAGKKEGIICHRAELFIKNLETFYEKYFEYPLTGTLKIAYLAGILSKNVGNLCLPNMS